MRIVLFAIGILFLGFAALQHNDSNALVWASMYIVTAGLTFAAALGKAPRFLLITVSVVCLAGAAWTANHEICNTGCRIGTDVPGPVMCGLLLGGLAIRSSRRPL